MRRRGSGSAAGGRTRNRRILITGSEGLVGSALRVALEARGAHVTGLDLRGSDGEEGDVRNAGRVRDAAAGCHGIVHLAAVSRVVWGEREPETCSAGRRTWSFGRAWNA